MTMIEVTDAPRAEDAERVVGGLVAFNNATVGPSGRQPLAAFVRPGTGAPVEGGVVGYTAWDWLYVEKVWITESLRGQGMAGKLLDAAEAEARRRGCKGAWLDTLNPKARAVYERQGYQVCGEIPDFTAGQSRVFLQKRF
jgi:GNAT superfamily N-acetyltransferase